MYLLGRNCFTAFGVGVLGVVVFCSTFTQVKFTRSRCSWSCRCTCSPWSCRCTSSTVLVLGVLLQAQVHLKCTCRCTWSWQKCERAAPPPQSAATPCQYSTLSAFVIGIISISIIIITIIISAILSFCKFSSRRYLHFSPIFMSSFSPASGSYTF